MSAVRQHAKFAFFQLWVNHVNFLVEMFIPGGKVIGHSHRYGFSTPDLFDSGNSSTPVPGFGNQTTDTGTYLDQDGFEKRNWVPTVIGIIIPHIWILTLIILFIVKWVSKWFIKKYRTSLKRNINLQKQKYIRFILINLKMFKILSEKINIEYQINIFVWINFFFLQWRRRRHPRNDNAHESVPLSEWWIKLTPKAENRNDSYFFI